QMAFRSLCANCAGAAAPPFVLSRALADRTHASDVPRQPLDYQLGVAHGRRVPAPPLARGTYHTALVPPPPRAEQTVKQRDPYCPCPTPAAACGGVVALPPLRQAENPGWRCVVTKGPAGREDAPRFMDDVVVLAPTC